MIDFIDDHRGAYGVEPICTVLPIAPSTYHARVAQRRDPEKLSRRARRDLVLKPEIARVSAVQHYHCRTSSSPSGNPFTSQASRPPRYQ